MFRSLMNEAQSKQFQPLIDLIPTGKREAVSMDDLSKLMGLPSPDVRQMVLDARKTGVLICSAEVGYYFPEDGDELKEYVFRRRKYIRTATSALRPFEDTLKERKEGDRL